MEKLKSIVVIGLSSAFVQVLDAKIIEKLGANEKMASFVSGYGKMVVPMLWIVLAIFLGRKFKGILAEALLGAAAGAMAEIVGIIMEQVGKKEVSA